ncbi:MAG: TetR/AcrR family transcriptional regulator [Actinomycetota bacterium]|nr:TetR/AcrR family transcriptional regulator [Actinomycetota bacterium]
MTPPPDLGDDQRERTSRDAGGGRPRTRGGWEAVGTAAERRANHDRRGTARGQRTRRQVIDAARTVFERDGYVNARIADIVAEAGVARGSFYTYFPSKLAVFRVVAQEVDDAIGEALTVRSDEPRLDVVANLDRAHRRYLEVYKAHAAIYGLIEQVATIDEAVHERRLASRRRHVGRVTATITRWQERGLADADLDAATAAGALVSMVSNFCYWWLVGRDDAYDPEQAAVTLTELWVRALDLRVDPDRTPPTS